MNSAEPPTAVDLHARIIFGAGVLLLKGGGVPEGKARTILGGLRKDFGSAAVAHAVSRAADELPSAPIPWLRKVSELEARRRGKFPAGETSFPVAEAERLDSLDRRMGHLAEGKNWQFGWGPDPRDCADGVPLELYRKHGISPPDASLRKE